MGWGESDAISSLLLQPHTFPLPLLASPLSCQRVLLPSPFVCCLPGNASVNGVCPLKAACGLTQVLGHVRTSSCSCGLLILLGAPLCPALFPSALAPWSLWQHMWGGGLGDSHQDLVAFLLPFSSCFTFSGFIMPRVWFDVEFVVSFGEPYRSQWLCSQSCLHHPEVKHSPKKFFSVGWGAQSSAFSGLISKFPCNLLRHVREQ